MITFFTGPRMCFLASLASVKWPVDSTTTCAPTDSQGSFPGSLSLKTLMDLVVDGDAVRAGGDLVRQIAQDGIVFQQMGQGLGVGEIVDRHEFDIAVIERSAKHVSPDASESVDSYFNCHFASEIW